MNLSAMFRSAHQSRRPWGQRLFIYFLCWLVLIPAHAQTTLSQEPPFTATEPPPNVMVMFDDSGSMGGHRLPTPAGITLSATAATVSISGLGADSAGNWATRSWVINREHDWMLRAPALNPLWYNPAIRYQPWNKDGTLAANASIGGAVLTTNYGALGARANASQLTERDPRQVPGSSGYTSVTTAAGRGLLGTNPSEPITNLERGRLVTASTPNVSFRYHKLPFDFGPVITAGTVAPANGHADQSWTTHNDVSSPLDLFSRPVVSITGASTCGTQTVAVPTNRNGCFTNLAACQANAAATATVAITTWSRLNCAGTTETFTTNPGNLQCSRQRCPAGANSTFGAYQTGTLASLPALTCDFSRVTSCTSNATSTFSVNPGPLACNWRRPGCGGGFGGSELGVVSSSGSNPGNLVCYRSRSCTAPVPSFGAWTTSTIAPLGSCFARATCANVTETFTVSPGALSCGFTRPNCPGVVESFATNPGPLACWRRNDCSGGSATFTVNPGSLTCSFSRNNCSGVAESFPSDPGALTCFQRLNCDGSTTSPSATAPSTLTCPAGDGVPITYSPTSFTVTVSAVIRTPTAFTQTVSNLGTRTVSTVALVESVTRTPIGPQTFTAATMTPIQEQITRSPSSSTVNQCPVGTTQTSCTANINQPQWVCTPGATVNVPNPEALTPARYYTYTGTGSLGDPSSYRVVQLDRTRPSGAVFPVVDAVTGVAPSFAQSARTDCAARTSCTWPEEAQNFANWYLYYRNRMFAAQAVLSDAMSSMVTASQQQIRLGYGRINLFVGAIDPWRSEPGTTLTAIPDVDGFTNPGALVRGVRPFVVGTPARAEFFEWLQSLAWAGPTPNREAIDSVGRYFSWSDSRGPWGASPGTASTVPQTACRRNFAFLTTDGEWTNFGVGQPLLSATGPLATPGTPVDADGVTGPVISGAGANAGTTFTYNPSSWRQYTGGSSSQEGTLSDVAVYYWSRDLRPDLPNVLSPSTDVTRPNPAFWQSMSTFVVGYGLSASMDTPSNRELIRTGGTTINWPTVDTSQAIATGGERINDTFRAAMASRGDFYAARDIVELKNAILGTFQQLQFRQGSAGGIAVTGPVTTGSSLAFFPSYTTGNWSGSLRAYTSANLMALASGETPTPAWSASVPVPASRRVITSTSRTTGANFTASTLNASQTAQLTGSTFTATETVAFLRGDRSLELPATGAAGSAKFRRRDGVLADFINSAPLFVRAPFYGYSAMPTIGATYGAYVEARRSLNEATVFIGGNGGKLHAFNADTGVERFAYVPRGVYPDLASLASPGYVHRYFVDGQVTAGDFHDGTSWRSAIVGTTGAGGASVFAIDVSTPSAVSSTSVLWDLTKADNTHLGHIMGRGVIGRVRTGSGATDFRWVYINGNGYESQSNRAALIVVDLLTGDPTAIPVGPTWSSTDGLAARNGMGPPTVRYDGQRNIMAVYAGDKRGNVWRFDFSAGIPSEASGFGGSTNPLATLTDASGNRQPITAAPRLMQHPRGGLYIVLGTGKLIDVDDPISTATQGLWGIWERPGHDTTINRSVTTVISVSTATTSVISGTDTVTSVARSFTTNGIPWGTRLAWTVDLPNGERVVADPSLDLGVLSIASFRPSSIEDPCQGGGVSNLYRFDLASGRVDITATNGMVGALTPVASITVTTRTRSSYDLPSAMRGGGAGVSGAAGTATCTTYSNSIQGRPAVIARACPPFAPIRMWRQPLR
jgi:type IV pilus assembly protein PilY1